MSAEERGESVQSIPPPHEDPIAESLTDLIDRMDRERFRRALAQRDLQVVLTTVRVQPRSKSL